ncbi:hypothetical protein D3C86_1587750 [compost metagenome]
MERHVGLHAIAAFGHGGIEVRQRGVDIGHGRIGAAARGLRGHLGFDRSAQFHDLEHRFERAGIGEVDAQWSDTRLISDEYATPLARFHQPLVLQPGNRLADHGAADAEFLGQHGLRRQLGAARERATLDLLEQLFGNAVGQGAGGNFLEDGHGEGG